MTLNNKYDFILYFTVDKANPNGDPLNGNRPRINYEGLGEVSDVCIKRKIRNRMIDLGKGVFVQSDEKRVDEFRSLKDRFDSVDDIKIAVKDSNDYEVEKLACNRWLDVRSFGQVLAFKADDKKSGNKGVSIGIRGPVSIHTAVSEEVIDVTSMQITKSVNSETNKKNPSEKTSDTMGMKHRVDFGVYKLVGSINPQLSEKTGFSDEDAETLKTCLLTLFENDASSARPEGSIEVNKLFWFKHNSTSGQYSAAKMHRCINLEVENPEMYTFERYGIIENVPEGFAREEKSDVLVEYIGL
ncbi:type I-C CRISPR-associated protein Cas7/Csd2 [Tissierella creatinini]|nr:type I-C CRISPR-associated protein Cas7/Csd2 [Tissierella creatinini]TJX64644.1 type I-C CRISPR-associated protein Cas7/Csd2 [Soehngenia saccharolytica]